MTVCKLQGMVEIPVCCVCARKCVYIYMCMYVCVTVCKLQGMVEIPVCCTCAWKCVCVCVYVCMYDCCTCA